MTDANRLLHSINAFKTNEPPAEMMSTTNIAFSSGLNRQSAHYLKGYSYQRSDLVNAIINRIALDGSMVDFRHLKIDPVSGDQTPVKSDLIDALTVSANIDQTGRAFIFDAIWSLLDEQAIAIVPIETTTAPNDSGAYDIQTLRVGKIMQWFPKHVRVRCYNEETGLEQDLTLSKRRVAIIESPLYSILKERNQTIKLLEQKIKLMNTQDAKAASGKLNGFIQFPYATKNDSRKKLAANRLRSIDEDMSNSTHGIASLDANEKWINTGGNIMNNVLDDIRRLQQDFYNQTGITESVMNGTAKEEEYNRYFIRTVDPILTTIVDALNKVFITKTARTQGQIIAFYRNPFKGMAVANLAAAAEVFTRNAILAPNEVRTIFLGIAPHPNKLANELYNRNISDKNQMGGINSAGQDIDGDGIPDDPDPASDEALGIPKLDVPETPDLASLGIK